MDQSKLARNNINLVYRDVEMPGNWHFNHLKTLKRNELAYNSKYETGEYEPNGFRKFFFNIVKNPCDVASKYIDLDTKDFILISERAEEDIKVWLLSHDLKQWMKEQNFAQLLNEIVDALPKDGSVVLKKTKDSLKKVNLHNLRLDPTAPSLEESSFVYEVHLMNRHELKNKNWNKKAIKELLSQNEKDPFIKIYECYDINVGEGKKWKRTILGDLYCIPTENGVVKSIEANINEEMNDVLLPGIVLHEDEMDELPYRETHWERVVGRWLGRGFVELLSDNQIAENEAENLERKALYWKALQIWQTRDEAVGRNVMTDVENGDILRISSEVTPIQKENSDLAAFNSTRNRWTGSTAQLTFSFDISRGENLPSRTPLGVANLQASSVVSFFEKKQENLGNFLRQLTLNDIIPDFKKKSRKEHLLTIGSSESVFQKLVKAETEKRINEALAKYVMDTGFMPSQVQIEFEKQRIAQNLQSRRNLRYFIEEGFYDDAKFSVDVLITGEQLNVAVRDSLLQFAIQTVSTNPAVLQNKGTRTMLFKLLEQRGISPVDLNLIEETIEQNPMPLEMQGGSLAAPNTSSQMMQGKMEMMA